MGHRRSATGTSARELLALYDRDQRRDIEYRGYRREATPSLVRHVDLAGKRGFVLHSCLDGTGVEAAIREQLAYFSGLGQSFEWKVYDHDTPADLKNRLMAHGFQAEAPEVVAVLDLDASPEVAQQPTAHVVRRLTTSEALNDLVSVHTSVWGEDRGWLGRQLAAELSHDPGALGVYVAYDGKVPVSAAWIRSRPGSHFAGLWGGSTLPTHRRRGFYSALLMARVQEARRRGARYLTVDAGAMSRPILERFGFRPLCRAQSHVWVPDGSDATRR